MFGINSLISSISELIRRKRELDVLKTPKIIFLYVTNCCNLSCSHCFYSAKLNDPHKKILTLDNIKKIFSTLKYPLENIVLTGGEPLLRNDLDEVIKVISIQNHPKCITINTNGYCTDRLELILNRLLVELPHQSIKIAVSLDGVKQVHDQIRQNPKSFEYACDSIDIITKISHENPRVAVRINTAVSMKNINSIEELFDFTCKRFKLFPRLQIVRGASSSVYRAPRGLGASDLDPLSEDDLVTKREELEQIHNVLKRIILKYRRQGIECISTFQQMKLKYQLETLLFGVKRVNCVAGRYDGIIYEDGTVAICENLKVVDSLANYDFDFHALWNSSKVRGLVKSLRCYCVHACNLSTSIMHDMRSRISIYGHARLHKDPLLGALRK